MFQTTNQFDSSFSAKKPRLCARMVQETSIMGDDHRGDALALGSPTEKTWSHMGVRNTMVWVIMYDLCVH